MIETNAVIVFLILACAVLFGLYCFQRKIWIGVIIFVAYTLRILYATVFQGDIQYNFVLDSLGYEYRAWLLAQKWMTMDIFGSLNRGYMPDFNFYEPFLAFFFKVFGRNLFIPKMVNSFFGVLTIYFIYRIQRDFLRDVSQRQKKGMLISELVTTCILAIYPAFVVWSASNIRDPLYFLATVSFFYFFFKFTSLSHSLTVVGRIGSLLASAFSYWLIHGVRSYVAPLFILALFFGSFFAFLARYVRPFRLAMSFGVLGIASLFAYQAAAPAEIADLLKNLQTTRLSFSNLIF